MKNCYLLPLLLLFTTPIFAQHHPEFGISARAGNFTWPEKGPGPQPLGFTHSKSSLSAGSAIGFGLYGQVDIRPRWGLTAELRYTISSFSTHEKFNYDPQVDQYMLLESDWTRHYVEHTLVLPLKMQYNLGAADKTVLALGVASSFNLNTHQTISSALPEAFLNEGGFYSSRKFYAQDQHPAEPAPRFQLLLVASLYRHIGAHTSVGIEIMASPRQNDLSTHFLTNENRISVERSPFSMKSLAVSLRQGIIW